MTWAATLIEIADALTETAVFGETVTLEGGATLEGIFDPVGTPPEAPWSQVGVATRLNSVVQPRLWLSSAAAASLTERVTVLSVRDQSYRVASIGPDDGGLVMVRLTPEQTDTTLTGAWR